MVIYRLILSNVIWGIRGCSFSAYIRLASGTIFYNHSRQYEHEQFLSWLIEQIKEKQPHALLISGDIFDVINPASSAQKQLYQFLADAHAIARICKR